MNAFISDLRSINKEKKEIKDRRRKQYIQKDNKSMIKALHNCLCGRPTLLSRLANQIRKVAIAMHCNLKAAMSFWAVWPNLNCACAESAIFQRSIKKFRHYRFGHPNFQKESINLAIRRRIQVFAIFLFPVYEIKVH